MSDAFDFAGGFMLPAVLVTHRARCFQCGEPVMWLSIEGVLRAVDPEPVPWGDIIPDAGRTAVVVQPNSRSIQPRYQPHEDMCEGVRSAVTTLADRELAT